MHRHGKSEIEPFEIFTHIYEDETIGTLTTVDSRCQDLVAEDGYLDQRKIDLRARTAPSAIMISKASKSLTRIVQIDERNTYQRSVSPTLSMISKPSSEDWSIDKDLIRRTYDKYQSFTPFKTPIGSHHAIPEEFPEKTRKLCELRSPTASKRQILVQSMHNLNQFLPDEEQSLKTNNSFIRRTLSPSRSMFIRQQKQPPSETVPSEIIVSQVNLNVNKRTRSPFALRVESMTVQPRFIPECDDDPYLQGPPPPTPIDDTTDKDISILDPVVIDAPVISGIIEEEEDEWEEEVLINTELFSSEDVSSFNITVPNKAETEHKTVESHEKSLNCSRQTLEHLNDNIIGNLTVDRQNETNDGDSPNGINESISSTPVSFADDISMPGLLHEDSLDSDRVTKKEEINEVDHKEDQTLSDTTPNSNEADNSHAEIILENAQECATMKGDNASNSPYVDQLHENTISNDENKRPQTPADEIRSRSCSPYFDVTSQPDFTNGLNLDLDIDEEILRAMDGLEEFMLDDLEDIEI